MRRLLLYLALFFTAGVCAAQNAPQALRIAAAADLQPVLPAVLDGFEKATGIRADAAYGSSAVLTQQIFNGAPFDLLLAADTAYPQKLVDKQLTSGGTVVYARGSLVLWARHSAPMLQGQPLTFAVLRYPSLNTVAIANPQTAPYGKAAQAAIDGLSLTSTLAPKLRRAANIAQAAQFADSGNADVGFLSLTSALTPKLKADGSYVPVPRELYPPILQGAVVLKGGKNAVGAGRFLDYLRSPGVQATLRDRGLDPAP